MWLTSTYTTGRCNVLCIQTVQLYYTTFSLYIIWSSCTIMLFSLYRQSSCTIQYPACTDGPIVLYNVLPVQMVQLYYTISCLYRWSNCIVQCSPCTDGPVVLYNILPVQMVQLYCTMFSLYRWSSCTIHYPHCTDGPVLLYNILMYRWSSCTM